LGFCLVGCWGRVAGTYVRPVERRTPARNADTGALLAWLLRVLAAGVRGALNTASKA